MTKILDNINVDLTCRSCLAQCDELSSLYSLAETFYSSLTLGDILFKLFRVKLNQTLDLPTKICASCQKELISAYNFKLKIQECENVLAEFLNNKASNTDIINESERGTNDDFNYLKIKDETYDDNFFEESSNPDIFQNDSKLCANENLMKGEKNVESEYKNEIVEDLDHKLLKKTNNAQEKTNYAQENTTDKSVTNRRKIGNFGCTQCSSSFSTQYQLDNHAKIHSRGPIKFYCKACDKCFATNRNLERHLKLHSKNINQKNSVTSVNIEKKIEKDCDHVEEKSKISNEDSSKTLKTKSSGIEKNYGCKNCSAKFSNSSQLGCHMKAHTGKNFYCAPCDRFFVNNRNLQRHLKLHDEQKDNKFKCSHCDKVFETKIKCKIHERNHCQPMIEIDGIDFDKNNCMPNENKSLECKICEEKFDKIYLLRGHLLQHGHEQTIDPTIVENNYYLSNIMPDGTKDIQSIINYISDEIRNYRLQKFYSATNMIGNELNISDSETDIDDNEADLATSRAYTCDSCYQTFDRRHKILFHQRNVHQPEENKYECDFCGTRYVSENLLHYHKKTQCYNNEKQFTCDVCKMKFMWKSNIEQHIMIHHSKSRTLKLIRNYTSKRKLDCEICHKKFSRPEHLERHLRTHNPAEKRFECPTCKKKFSRKDNLRCHMKVHDDKRTDIGDEGKHFLCVFCGRKFRNSSNLVVHTRRHTGEKPFKCDFCDKGFPRSSDLRTHRRTHTGEKPHLCNTCGKGFSRSNKLTRHMRIHTGDRPYKCTYCERAFTQSNDLTIHIRRHTGEKPYTCGICGERFIQGTALQTHRKTRGHYEDVEGIEVPFAHLSQHNPNPLNNAGRVDQIGVQKFKISTDDIKNLQNDIIEEESIRSAKGRETENKSNSSNIDLCSEGNSDSEAISGNAFNYKDISSFIVNSQPHSFPHLTIPLLQGVTGVHQSSQNGIFTSSKIFSSGIVSSNYSNDSN